MFLIKGVLENVADFQEKHLCQSLSFNEVPVTDVSLWILRIFKNTFLTEHLWTSASVDWVLVKTSWPYISFF